MTAYLVEMFGLSLIFTLGIESAIAFFFGLRSVREMLLVLLVNVLTNPPAVLFSWLLASNLPEVSSIGIQCLTEITVIVLEAYIYDRFSVRHSLLLSVCANLSAWLFGITLS